VVRNRVGKQLLPLPPGSWGEGSTIKRTTKKTRKKKKKEKKSKFSDKRRIKGKGVLNPKRLGFHVHEGLLSLKKDGRGAKDGL